MPHEPEYYTDPIFGFTVRLTNNPKLDYLVITNEIASYDTGFVVGSSNNSPKTLKEWNHKRMVVKLNNVFEKRIFKYAEDPHINLLLSHPKTYYKHCGIYFFHKQRILLMKNFKDYRRLYPNLTKTTRTSLEEYLSKPWIQPSLKPIYVNDKDDRRELKYRVAEALEFKRFLHHQSYDEIDLDILLEEREWKNKLNRRKLKQEECEREAQRQYDIENGSYQIIRLSSSE